MDHGSSLLNACFLLWEWSSEPITDPPERFEPSQTPTSVPQMRSEPPITLLHPMEIAQRLRTPSSSTVPTLQVKQIVIEINLLGFWSHN